MPDDWVSFLFRRPDKGVSMQLKSCVLTPREKGRTWRVLTRIELRTWRRTSPAGPPTLTGPVPELTAPLCCPWGLGAGAERCAAAPVALDDAPRGPPVGVPGPPPVAVA